MLITDIKTFPENKQIAIVCPVKGGYSIRIFENKQSTKENSYLVDVAFDDIIKAFEYAESHYDVYFPTIQLSYVPTKEQIEQAFKELENANI